MANKRFWLGMLVMALVFGMTVIGCDNGSGNTHTHSYSTTWSSNATQHWHECTANDDAKPDVADHTGDPCTVCGYSSGSNGTDPALNGTWGYTEGGVFMDYYTFNNGSLEISMFNIPYSKGTYTTSGHKLTMNITHIYGKNYAAEGIGINLDAKWYTLTEYFAALETYFDEEEWAEIAILGGQGITMTYSVNGNTLTLIQSDETGTETIIMTRK